MKDHETLSNNITGLNCHGILSLHVLRDRKVLQEFRLIGGCSMKRQTRMEKIATLVACSKQMYLPGSPRQRPARGRPPRDACRPGRPPLLTPAEGNQVFLKYQGTISHHLYSINEEMVLQESMQLCRDLKDMHILEKAVNKNKVSLEFNLSIQWKEASHNESSSSLVSSCVSRHSADMRGGDIGWSRRRRRVVCVPHDLQPEKKVGDAVWSETTLQTSASYPTAHNWELFFT
ncbi:uncharacterized protein LOC141749512 [Larus michahellis]|uniref:uncharacterized protein LOC141749512 n=1 Tax=Larus michahellis TaxID=119627 RepID=UPI003D9B4A9F